MEAEGARDHCPIPVRRAAPKLASQPGAPSSASAARDSRSATPAPDIARTELRREWHAYAFEQG